jgi:hypothetical protein
MMPSRPSGERGSALIGVLLLLMVMTALASALAVSSQTETLVARNHESAAQARAAAEAGLNHAAELVTAWILKWKQNGYADSSAAVDDLLVQLDADPDFIAGLTFGNASDPVAIDANGNAEYHVFLFDEDDGDDFPDGRGADDATQLTDDTTASNDEDGNALTDNNKAIVLQAVGYAGRNRRGASVATVTLEAIISPYKLPALATDGDLTLAGTAAAIVVTEPVIGGVHANGDLTIAGATAIIGVPTELGTATATGTCEDCSLPTITTNPGDSGGGKKRLDIPEIRASDFLDWADYILHDNGQLEIVGNPTLVDCSKSCKGVAWSYQSKSMEWTLTNTTDMYATGTFYVEGPVTISAGTLLVPAVATIIATGSITGSGNNYIVPAAGDLLFVTDKDLELSGGFNAGVALNQGQMLVREQIALSGNAVLYGQLVIGDCATLDDPCTTASTETPDTSSLSGNVVLTNSQDVGTSMFRVSGWREVR